MNIPNKIPEDELSTDNNSDIFTFIFTSEISAIVEHPSVTFTFQSLALTTKTFDRQLAW